MLESAERGRKKKNEIEKGGDVGEGGGRGGHYTIIHLPPCCYLLSDDPDD